MASTASRIRRWLGGLLAAVLITAAVLLTLLRLALPLVGEYRSAITARVSAYLGTPITVERLDVEWHGLGPRLRMDGLRIAAGEDGRPPVTFEEAFVELGPAPGQRPLPFAIDGIVLSGAALEARRTADGRLSLLGFTLDPGALRPGGGPAEPAGRTSSGGDGELPPGARRVLAWLLSVPRLAVVDAELTVAGPGGEVRRVPRIDLHVANDAGRHRLSLDVALPPALGGRARVIADLAGIDERTGRGWRGRIFASTTDLALGRLAPLAGALPLQPAGGRIDAALWTDWRGGRLERALLDAAGEGVALGGAGEARRPVRLERVAGLVEWTRREAGWVVDGHRLDIRRDGRAWPETAFRIEHGRGPGRVPYWTARTSFVDVADAAAFAERLPLAPSVAERLPALAPRGTLRDVRLRHSRQGDLELRGAFTDLAWSPVGTLPGAAGLDGELRIGPGGGRLHLDSRDARLEAPRLFGGPLPLDRVSGTVTVERGPDGVTVQSPHIEVANEDLRASARMAVRVPRDAPLFLDIQADFREGDVGAASRYLPRRIMGDDVVRWLDRALIAGRVTGGTMILRGPADHFPYRGNEGAFDIDFRVADARVAFDRHWPPLRRMDGRVEFDGPSLTITSGRARLFDSRVRRMRARFDDLAVPRLRIEGDLRGDMTDVIRTMTETPLAKRVGPAFRGARGSGPVDIELALDIPLEDVNATRVDGHFRVAGAALAQPRFGLDFTGLAGSGRFSGRGVVFDGVRGRLHGQPVTLGASTPAEPAPAQRFTIRGELGARELLPGLDPGIAQRLRGRSPWDVTVRVPHAARRDGVVAWVDARSDLRGTAVELPAPLGKAPDRARALRIGVTLAGGGSDPRAELRYGAEVRSVLDLDAAGGVERAALGFGGQRPRLPEAPGLRVGGRLETLALRPWLALVGAPAAGGRAGTSAGEGAWPEFRGGTLLVEELRHGARRASEVALRARRTRDGLEVEAHSNEFQGRIVLPPRPGSDRRPIKARFDWIDLALLSPPAGAGGGDAGTAPDPRGWPALDLRAERVKLADGTLHDVALVTNAAAGGLTIHRLQARHEGLTLEGQGRWSAGAGGSATSLRLTLAGEDFGRGLAAIGYGDLLSGGEGRVTADLRWPGPPWTPAPAVLAGHATLDLADGTVRRLDVGPARLLGLFSLDVQGLLQRGFPFGRIEGRVDFDGGNAFTRDLVIEGPAGRIRVEGRTGLAARDYDQTIHYRPQLSRSLPIIGALSGGPAAGLAVALLQGLLRNLGADVEEATEVQYRLTGTWAEPKVQRVTERPSEPADATDPDPGVR